MTADDGHGLTQSSAYPQDVLIFTHAVTITAGPVGAPNPVLAGATAALSVTARDSLNHPLTYRWTAACPSLGSNGLFSPSADVKDPAWQAPANLGADADCTLSVTVFDGLGKTASASYTHVVAPTPDTIAVTSPPTGTPNPVASGAAVSLSAAASDSRGHTLTYSWAAACPAPMANGVFQSGNLGEVVVWTAPANVTAAQQVCNLTVTVTDGHGQSAVAIHQQRVDPAPHLVTITAAAAGDPNPVASEAAVALSVTAVDELGHPVSYGWRASCPAPLTNGTFLPSAAVQAPTWTAPRNLTDATQTCTLLVTASDGYGQAATSLPIRASTPSRTPSRSRRRRRGRGPACPRAEPRRCRRWRWIPTGTA